MSLVMSMNCTVHYL